jgi:outer membrane protein OmpA-like peptidoglycan-associated protein
MGRSKFIALGLLVAISIGISRPTGATSCMRGPYIIFFDAGIAYIKEPARQILDNAISAAGNCGYGATMLAGHTDGSEDSSLAEKRLNTVRAYLVAHGIPQEDISMESFGATQPRVLKPDEASDEQNRRVEISFGPIMAALPG